MSQEKQTYKQIVDTHVQRVGLKKAHDMAAVHAVEKQAEAYARGNKEEGDRWLAALMNKGR